MSLFAQPIVSSVFDRYYEEDDDEDEDNTIGASLLFRMLPFFDFGASCNLKASF